MSTIDLAIAPSTAERPRAVPKRSARLPWAHVALACAVLASAGGLRWYQGRRVEQIKDQGKVSPFALKELPMVLGEWQVPDRREGKLDAEIISYTGCTDYVWRPYVDDRTGVRVEVMVLYGPSTIAHVPEVCYPGAGFKQVGAPTAQVFDMPGKLSRPASFNSLVFTKGQGGSAEWEQVAYSLRYGGRWTPVLDYRTINRLPGLYKIQLARRVSEGEHLDIDNPCQSLLEVLLPELEQRITGSRSTATR